MCPHLCVICLLQVLAYAGYRDADTNATGCAKTLGNFIKVRNLFSWVPRV